MVDRQRKRQVAKGSSSCALLAASLAGLYAADAAALPRVAPADGAAPRIILIQSTDSVLPQASQGTGADQERAPFAELNEALAAARARLEELSKAAAAAAAAGQARQELETIRQENQQLRSELAAVSASRDELRASSQQDAGRFAELTAAAEEAAAEADRIEEELVRMRWQNAQLNTSLARARAAQERTEEDARATQTELATKVDTLSSAAERSATEIARLRQELDDARQRLEGAGRAQERVAALDAGLRDAQARSSDLEKQLAAVQGRVGEAVGARDRALQRLVETESERERLRAELAVAKGEIERVVATRGELEEEVKMLRAGASSAAYAARQNLLAVEERIKELNAALAGTGPATGGATPALVSAADADRLVATRPAVAPIPPPSQGMQVVALAARSSAVGNDLELIKSANAAEERVDEALTRLTPDVPLEIRLQVQGLLVDLGAKIESGGLKVTVPGGQLFAINSERIESTAYDTLAKVAELIDAYDGHEVMIVGHTDAVGDEAYNRTLSLRRAELVRQFFVDNFDIAPARLATDGRGEAQPIATNATVTGRQANRRVDVVILD